eukprot:14252309-Alexandrium_andersonii.AAC.1
MFVKTASSRPNPHVYAAAFATTSPQSRTSLYASEPARAVRGTTLRMATTASSRLLAAASTRTP